MSEDCTCETVKATFRPWLSGRIPQNLSSFSLFHTRISEGVNGSQSPLKSHRLQRQPASPQTLRTSIAPSNNPEWFTRKRTEFEGQLLRRNVQRFRGGLVSKAHRFLYHSTLGSRIIKKRREAPASRPNRGVTILDVINVNQKSTQWPVAQILSKHHKLTVSCGKFDF